MREGKKRKSQRVLKTGCFLMFVLVVASVFVGGVILSTRGIGVVGKSSESTKSPIGSWTLPNGTIQQYRADGTGSATTQDGDVTYFEWRLRGDELAVDWFSNPSSVGARLFRLRRGLALAGDRGSTNYVIVDATADKMTLAIDDERRGPPPTWERGDQFECTATLTEQTQVKAASDEEAAE